MLNKPRIAALSTLMILQVTMLLALLFKVPPHPPETIPIGGMAPVIGAALCAAFAAMILNGEGLVGKALVVLACLLAAISYGPQKFFDPAFALVWPAVLTAQVAILVLIVDMTGVTRRGEAY